MTKEEIIEMARKAGVEDSNEYNHLVCTEVELVAFAKLIAEKEREACAKLCDDELKEWGIFDSDVGDVSKAIRARGNHD